MLLKAARMEKADACGAGLLQFYHDESGAELVEWAMLTLVVVLGSYALLVAVREELGQAFLRIIRGLGFEEL